MPLLVETETIKRIAVRLLLTYEDRQSLTAVRLLISLLQNELVMIVQAYIYISLPETSTLEMEIEGHYFLLQFRGGFWYMKPGGNDYKYS